MLDFKSLAPVSRATDSRATDSSPPELNRSVGRKADLKSPSGISTAERPKEHLPIDPAWAAVEAFRDLNEAKLKQLRPGDRRAWESSMEALEEDTLKTAQALPGELATSLLCFAHCELEAAATARRDGRNRLLSDKQLWRDACAFHRDHTPARADETYIEQTTRDFVAQLNRRSGDRSFKALLNIAMDDLEDNVNLARGMDPCDHSKRLAKDIQDALEL